MWETVFHTKNCKSPRFLCHTAFVSPALLLTDCWSSRQLWQYNPANISLENTQESVAISKPGVPRRSLSAACAAQPSSEIVLVLPQSMNSCEGTWHWLLLKGNCWSSLWTGSSPARRASLRTANRPSVCAGKARCTAGKRERDFCKPLLWGVRVHSGNADLWRSKEITSGS